jgi:DNA invertase Pin-like site-specific DNA recombinase
MNEIVAYIRVSTKRQGDSGLGLQAQRTAIDQFAKQFGRTVIATYQEVESGKKSDRPELAKALAHARRANAALCTAKLDRVARNVELMAGILNSGVEFVAADNPSANRMVLRILSAVAEAEAKAISERTTRALAEAKKNGKLLGSSRPGHWKGREDRRLIGAANGGKAAAKVHRQAAQQAYLDLLPTMTELRNQGSSLQAIADTLNTQGHRTRQGKPWNPMQVSRVLERSEK